jgi:hypothetical protein
MQRLEKPPRERFAALDMCTFTAQWFVSCALLCAEKRQKEHMNWQIEDINEPSARFSVWIGDGFAQMHSVLAS